MQKKPLTQFERRKRKTLLREALSASRVLNERRLRRREKLLKTLKTKRRFSP